MGLRPARGIGFLNVRPAMKVAVVVLVLVIAACGGSNGTKTTSTSVATSTTPPTFGGVPGAAQAVACRTNVSALQQASDLYKAAHGSPAPSLDALMKESGITRTPSPNDGYQLAYAAATGHVSASGACTVP